MTISKLVFAKFPQVLFENILRQFRNLFLPILLISSSKTFQDNFETCLCQYSSYPLRKGSKTISKLVLAKFPHFLFENVLRQFQNLSLPSFFIFSSRIFFDNFKTCLCQISSSPLREHSKTFPKLVFNKIPQVLFENILRQFQNLSLPNFLISSSRTFQDTFKTCLCQYSSSPSRKHSKTVSKFVFARFPHLLSEIFLRQLQNLSVPGFLTSSLKIF